MTTYYYIIAGNREDLRKFLADALRKAEGRLGQTPAVGRCNPADLAELQAAAPPALRIEASRYVARRGVMLAADDPE